MQRVQKLGLPYAVIRKSEGDETGLEDDKQAALDDVGYDADLCISNQVVVHVHDWSFRLIGGWIHI